MGWVSSQGRDMGPGERSLPDSGNHRTLVSPVVSTGRRRRRRRG